MCLCKGTEGFEEGHIMQIFFELTWLLIVQLGQSRPLPKWESSPECCLSCCSSRSTTNHFYGGETCTLSHLVPFWYNCDISNFSCEDVYCIMNVYKPPCSISLQQTCFIRIFSKYIGMNVWFDWKAYIFALLVLDKCNFATNSVCLGPLVVFLCYWQLVLWCNSTFFLQTRWSLVSRLRLTQVVGTWEPGGEKMERQRRNVEGKRKGREEEWNRVLWGKSLRVNSGWEVVRFFRFLVWKINQWQALVLRTSRLPPMWPHWAFSRHCG